MDPAHEQPQRIVLYDDLDTPLAYPTGKVPEITFRDLSQSPSGVAAYHLNHLQPFQNPDISRLARNHRWSPSVASLPHHRPVHTTTYAVFEWGPNQTLGFLAFGPPTSRPKEKMSAWIVKRSSMQVIAYINGGKITRSFTASGTTYKWRTDDGDRFELATESNPALPVAVWTRWTNHARPTLHGVLIVSEAGFPVLTEIVATLLLNRLAVAKGW
ncbi:hypothetical protein BKA62DRAFT_719149 [Auriculariales sp. MPI-PUGE-AT-0066]|nr:hypothetical protein BKA62DRAFT_719149 [Auriculariales sp. MPI-PUGE-AT-0066]